MSWVWSSTGEPIASQNIVIDANNSYTGTIAGSGTKTCTASAVTPITSIQVYFAADQNCIVYVDQGSSISVFGIIDSFNYFPAVAGSGSFIVTSAAPYFRIRVTNLSATTVNVVMYAALVPVLNTLPRALDDEGYLKVGTKSIRGKMGRVRISPMGAQKSATAVRLAGQAITGNVVDGSFWASTVTPTGAVTQIYGEMTLTTDTTANSGILVNSQRVARYTAGLPNYFRGNITLPAVTTGTAGFVNTRRWGAFDAANGYFFAATQTNPASTPTLSVVARKTDGTGLNDTPVTAFNGDYGATFPLNNNVHTYEIWWTNKAAYFWIDDILLHTITTTTTPAVVTPHLKIGLQCFNSGNNNVANTLLVRSASINRLGNLQTQPLNYYRATTVAAQVLKYGPGNLHSLSVSNITDGTAVTLYDALAATGGTEIWASGVLNVKNTLNSMLFYIDFKGIPFSTGLTLAIATQNCTVQIAYE
jgi:hypothetical protein